MLKPSGVHLRSPRGSAGAPESMGDAPWRHNERQPGPLSAGSREREGDLDRGRTHAAVRDEARRVAGMLSCRSCSPAGAS